MPSFEDFTCECGQCDTCILIDEIEKEAWHSVEIRRLRIVYMPKWIQEITEKIALLKLNDA